MVSIAKKSDWLLAFLVVGGTAGLFFPTSDPSNLSNPTTETTQSILAKTKDKYQRFTELNLYEWSDIIQTENINTINNDQNILQPAFPEHASASSANEKISIQSDVYHAETPILDRQIPSPVQANMPIFIDDQLPSHPTIKQIPIALVKPVEDIVQKVQEIKSIELINDNPYELLSRPKPRPTDISRLPLQKIVTKTGIPNATDALKKKQTNLVYRSSIISLVKQNITYPRRLNRLGIGGVASLVITIQPDGLVDSFQIIQSTGHEGLDNAIVDSISKSVPFPPHTDDPFLTVEMSICFQQESCSYVHK